MKQTREAVILAVCLITLGFSLSVLFGIWRMYQAGDREYKELQEYVEKESETNDTGLPEETIDVDFDSLKGINADIVAWIRCVELGIDYPVVQGEDNEYYLTHTFFGKEHISGCIFMDCMNRADFTDDNVIFYGHNMKDGSMFGSFARFEEEEATVYVYTPEGNYTYQMIDNRIVDISEEMYFRTSYGTEDFASLSAAIAGHTGVQLVESDHLLTLSTCNGNDSQRHLILCRRIEAAPQAAETDAGNEMAVEETQMGGTQTEEEMTGGDIDDAVVEIIE